MPLIGLWSFPLFGYQTFEYTFINVKLINISIITLLNSSYIYSKPYICKTSASHINFICRCNWFCGTRKRKYCIFVGISGS